LIADFKSKNEKSEIKNLKFEIRTRGSCGSPADKRSVGGASGVKEKESFLPSSLDWKYPVDFH